MHRNIKIAIIANTRDEFENASDISNIIYNDNPSKKSIDYLLSEIRCLGFESFFFGGIEELITACKEKKEYQNTLFFNLSDGLTQPSRKGQAAFLLEILGVPYIGSDPFTRLMTANKSYTKQFLCSQEITSPNGHIIRSLNDFSQYDIEYPIMIKPNNEGSSIGITQESVAFDFTSAVYYLCLLYTSRCV
uniref:ATP-grasp domain-containing protein n=1 Tax=Candidatus Enterococcus clewellii TaxID=1834193 RepID=A0A242K1N8_9ENTE|nr:hypothetical protein [Enterococcus sp. 9E7_DIV0242]OTP11577.1 hypothetical protein A5888_003676 [Enterococcus sp. 9E7_DIV0242]